MRLLVPSADRRYEDDGVRMVALLGLERLEACRSALGHNPIPRSVTTRQNLMFGARVLGVRASLASGGGERITVSIWREGSLSGR